MSDVIQLNLFGDILFPSEEITNEPEFSGRSSRESLEDISSTIIPEAPGGRGSGERTFSSKQESIGKDQHPDRAGIAPAGSTGDRPSGGDSFVTGTTVLNITPGSFPASPSVFSISALNHSFSISTDDFAAIQRQYAANGAGFQDLTNKTIDVFSMLRASMGMKLWEEMSDTERTAEIFNRIKTDFETAQNEIQFKPVNYLLDRALDPLDPLSDFYKVILKNLGAQINGNAVKLPDHLELEIARESLRYDQSLRARYSTVFHTDNKNYHITGDPIGKGGKVAKFNANSKQSQY